MTSHPFLSYHLRTTDPDAARAFYAGALDLDVTGATAPGLRVWRLHEQAIARGAPPHWLGQVAVDDTDAAADRVVVLGGERLGPTLRAADGVAYAMVRDPLGAVLAVRAAAPAPGRGPVAWHHLHARDGERAWAIYAELFGWTSTGTADVAGVPGSVRTFAWSGGVSVGSVASTASAPGVHVHWMYYFPVVDLDAALARVRAHGGTAGAPVTLPSGDRLVPCEDPQRAAFGLIALAPRA